MFLNVLVGPLANNGVKMLLDRLQRFHSTVVLERWRQQFAQLPMPQSHHDIERTISLCGSERSPGTKAQQLLDDASWRAAMRSLMQHRVARLATKARGVDKLLV